MASEWYYSLGTERKGPVPTNTLIQLARDGVVTPSTLVWKSGMEEWKAASSVGGLLWSSVPQPDHAHAEPNRRGALRNIGGKISEVSDLPEIEDVPVREILFGGLSRRLRADEIEETLAVGSKKTTPLLEEIAEQWPRPCVFWRVLAVATVTYILLRIGFTEFQNPNFIPGMILVGSFVVPFSIVVFFFETNLPRNVSIYQVGKMLLLGGAIGLVATMVLLRFVPGSGTGNLIPALMTGALEETGKALALLMIVSARRYRWQTNGLLFGAAVGAGFAGFESAGYAFMTGMAGHNVFDTIMLRAMLSPGGHVIWTAMVASAIWKVKGDSPFEFSMMFRPVVVRRWIIAVVLHGLWDSNTFGLNEIFQCVILSLVGWYVTFAILKQALSEIDLARRAIQPARGSDAAI